MSNAGKSIGGRANAQHGAKGAGSAEPGTLDEFDLASDLKGKNSLQGEDQRRHRSQREAAAEATGDTDGLMESFEKLDDEVRAKRDLGKQRQHKDGQGASGSAEPRPSRE